MGGSKNIMDYHSRIENNAFASSSSSNNIQQEQQHHSTDCPNDIPFSLPRTMMDNDAASCVYKRPRHGISSNCFEQNRNDYVALVTPLTVNNIDSTITQIDDDNQQHTYNECIKRLRYTTIDVPFPGTGSCSHQISETVTMPTIAMETSTTAGSVIPSKDRYNDITSLPLVEKSIPWWIQQQSQRRQVPVSFPILPTTILQSKSKCRICQKPYVPGQIITDDTDEAVNMHQMNCTVTTTTTTTTNYAKKIVYTNTDSTSGNNKTLLSYFPLRSTLVHFDDDDDDDKKQRSDLSNTKASSSHTAQQYDTQNSNKNKNNSNNNIISDMMNTTTSQCHYCERNDFCPNCSIQSCITCTNHFCYFCRTIQQNGDIQCIDCYSSSNNNNHQQQQQQQQNNYNNKNTNYDTVEITIKSHKYKETYSYDEMDVD